MRTLATVAECEQSRDRLAELSERIADLLAETPTQRVQIARDLGRADPRLRQRLTALAELERSPRRARRRGRIGRKQPQHFI
jgi:hypothetical protein